MLAIMRTLIEIGRVEQGLESGLVGTERTPLAGTRPSHRRADEYHDADRGNLEQQGVVS